MAIRRLWLLLVGLLGGCAGTVTVPQDSSVMRTPIHEITNETLRYDYAAELAYRQRNEGPLKLGVALSGGGTKAAMFAHGILHGLHDAGVLQKVDVISTVSGGGYAAYWYFSKLIAREQENNNFAVSSIFADCIPKYWTDKEDKEAAKDKEPVEEKKVYWHLRTAMNRAIEPSLIGPFRSPTSSMQRCQDKYADHYEEGDPFRWQAHLARWPDVFGTAPVEPDGTRQKGPSKELRAGVFTALFIEPFTHALRFRSSIPTLYQSGIERTWGLNPQARNKAMLGPRKPEGPKWEYTNAAPESQGSPLRVNAAKLDWKALRALYNRTADAGPDERIPLWILNTNSGGKTKDAKANVGRTFELSAFGSGSEKLGYVNDGRPLIDDLATSVRASAGFADAQGLAGIQRTILELLSLIIPGARWGVPVQTVDTTGELVKLRLSDGGGAENTGLYSLLKRGVEDIIFVDASEDIEGNMQDICTLRKALGPDIEIEFPTLEDFDRVCEGKLAYNVSDWKAPVVQGTVTWKRNGVLVRTSRLWLLKAAWDQNWVRITYNKGRCGETDWADCFLTVFYGHNTKFRLNEGNADDLTMVFPQLPTTGATLNSSSYLFWGYRELGRSIARQLVWDGNRNRLETTSIACRQRAATRIRKNRPYVLEDRHKWTRCAELSEAPGSSPKSVY